MARAAPAYASPVPVVRVTPARHTVRCVPRQSGTVRGVQQLVTNCVEGRRVVNPQVTAHSPGREGVMSPALAPDSMRLSRPRVGTAGGLTV
jgi:hypothetical protein